MDLVRSLVSKQKRRWNDEGFNLDLTYITDNIIAMGFPSEGTEGLFRNPLSEVQHFLKQRHGDRFFVYNLCIERSYRPEKFDGRVGVFPFADHNAPSLLLIRQFCEAMNDWLKRDVKNVAAVHCKAGKGRTGTMICCYLLHCGAMKTAEDVLEFYGVRRTQNGRGVTIPSQIRYVHYFAETVQPNWDPARENIIWSLRRIILSHRPVTVQSNGETDWKPLFGVTRKDKTLLFVGREEDESLANHPIFSCDGLVVNGDLKFELFNGQSSERLFWFWVNTSFILPGHTGITLTKQELDGACKDKEHKLFPADFSVTIVFDRVLGRMRLKQPHHVSPAPFDPKCSTMDDSTSPAITTAPPFRHPNTILGTASPSTSPPPPSAPISMLSSSPHIQEVASSSRNGDSSRSASPGPEKQALCDICGLPLANEPQSVQSQGGKNFHWSCATCTVCGEHLGNRGSCRVAETTPDRIALICSNCDTFWKRCPHCKRLLQDGNVLHDLPNIGKRCLLCFCCSICQVSLTPAFDEDDEDVEEYEIIADAPICRSHSRASKQVFEDRMSKIGAKLDAALHPPAPSRPISGTSDPSLVANLDNNKSNSAVPSKLSRPPSTRSSEPPMPSQLAAAKKSTAPISIKTSNSSSALPTFPAAANQSEAASPSSSVSSSPSNTAHESPSSNRPVGHGKQDHMKLSLRKQRGMAVEMPRCGLCHGLIDGEQDSMFVGELSKSFHAEHFKCAQCSNVIMKGELYHIVGDNHRVYCNDCYSSTTTCCRCQKPLLGSHMQIGPELFVHQECFTCDSCHSIIKGSFATSGNSTLCIECSNRL